MSANAIKIKPRYSCTKCDKTFTVPFSLRRHMAIHDEATLVCQQCDRRFKTKEMLIRHEQIHSGERPHGCQICHKRFIRMTDLRKHLKTHEQKANPVKKIDSQAAQVRQCVNNGNINGNAHQVADKSSQAQAIVGAVQPPAIRAVLPNTTGRMVGKSPIIPTEVNSNLQGGQKQQLEEFVNKPVAAAQKVIVLFSVGTNSNNRIPEQCPSAEPSPSDRFQIAFQQILDELAKSGSSTVDRSNP